MALIFCDGFDWYQGGATAGVLSGDLAKRWTGAFSNTFTASVGPTYARSPSGQGLSVANNPGGPYKSFGTNYVSGCVGVAFYASSVANLSTGLITILDGTTEQISVRTNASSVLTATRNGTVLATGSTVLSINTWYYLEFKFTISNAAGVVEVKLNGAAEIASTGSLDTTNTANVQWNGVAIARPNTATVYFDDLYVLNTATGTNTDFLGPIQVVARYPTANGNYAQWTPNGGSNMGAISEPYEDGNTSFNQSSTANQIDTFTMQDLPAAVGSVYAVAHHLVASQDGGSARTIRPKYRIGGSDYNGTSVNTSASYQALTEYKDVSPATSAAWTVSEVNGMETGYELVS